MSIGKKIRERRIDARLSQVELAKRVGIAQNTLSVIEVGRTPDPSFNTVLKIATALGLTLDELVADPPKAPAGRRIEFRSGYDPHEYEAYREYLSAFDLDALIREGEFVRGEYLKAIEAGEWKKAEDMYYRFRAVEQVEHELRMAAEEPVEEPKQAAAGEPVEEKNNV
jgi:transcriptional regulator with XRE-family HTH domain